MLRSHDQRRSRLAVAALFLACMFSPVAEAQIIGSPRLSMWKYRQAYSPPRPAVESRVATCESPFPSAGMRVAMDDWICGASGPITNIKWCGVVLVPGQLGGGVVGQPIRPYLIQIWDNNPATCQALEPVFCRACVIPTHRPISTDCLGRTVYEFSAQLPPGCFSQVAGTRYWIQISEVDSQSARQGQPDFLWSAHVDIKNCPAMQLLPSFARVQPLFHVCSEDLEFHDLSFTLNSRAIVINPGPCCPVPSFPAGPGMVRFFDPNGRLVASAIAPLESDGSMVLDAEDLPDGQYLAEVKYPGALVSERHACTVADGTVTTLTFGSAPLGDLDADGIVGLSDIARIIASWGAGSGGGPGGTTGAD